MKDNKKSKSSAAPSDKGFSAERYFPSKPNIDKGFSIPGEPNIDKGFSAERYLPSKPASKKVKTPNPRIQTMKSGGKITTPMKGMKTSKSKPCK
jgi:hypothetical protein